MRFVVSFFCAVLVSVVLGGSGYGQTSFIRINEIPAADPGAHDSYYDIQTGDFLVALGPGLNLFGIGFSGGNNAGAFDVSFVDQTTALGVPIQNDADAILWESVAPLGLPIGVYNLGPLLEAYPLGPVPGGTELEFDAAAETLYGSFSPGLVSLVGTNGSDSPFFDDVNIIRPTFSSVAIPEPCSAILIPLAGAGLFLRRRA